MPKYLTLDDLYRYFEEHGKNFSCSKEDKLQFAVRVPGEFEIQQNEMKGLMRAKVKVCHTEMNRNHSYISEENMLSALPTLKYRPVLAYIHQLEDGTYDFYAHNVVQTKDEDGQPTYEYLEKQVGCFMDYEPQLEYDSENNKSYVIGYAAIPEEYTEAANIIRRKEGTKVSAELVIDEMTYNAKEKCLELIDFYFGGVTLLGCDENGTEIEEGMLGSRLDIADFAVSCDVNVAHDNDLMIKTIEGFDTDYSKKGGLNNMEEQTIETVVEETVEEPVVEEPVVDETVVVETTEPESVDEPVIDEPVVEETKQFSQLSAEEVRNALYKLIAPMEGQDNDFYDIVATYDDYVVVRGWENGRFYKIRYEVNESSVAIIGEREEVYQMIITAEEKAQIEEMRSNYADLKQFKDDYDAAVLKAEKDAVIAQPCYDSIRSSEDFAKIVSEAAELTVAELEQKCDLLFAAHKKTETPSKKEDTAESIGCVSFNFATVAEAKAYAGLFEE